MSTKLPFAIHVEDSVLENLRTRLRRTRWPDQIEAAGWDQGTERETLRSLVEYWAEEFDWPAYERELNALPQFKADGIHFVHQAARGTPILVVNGWPSTFLEELPLLEPLSEFDIVIPSLPGYGFSDRPSTAGMTPRAIAARFAELMRELGYDRFVAHGSDFGAEVVTQLALAHPDRVIGLHLSTFDWRPHLWRPLSAVEREYVEARDRSSESAYDELQSTKPQTLGYALNDSPAGLAGWFLEKWRSWSDCDGDVIGYFGADFLCATLTIYWATETATSSARLYYEHRWRQPPLGPGDHVDVPTAVALFAAGEPAPPREWAERLFNVTRWTEMPRGGHFAATEEPELLATDIAAFLTKLLDCRTI
jgi:pimeloyl-ACP methyl ester carboxylesterase